MPVSLTAYQDLEKRFQKMAVLGEAQSMLHWDMAVMMPPGGAHARAEQMAALRVMHHNQMIDPAVGDLLDESEMMQLDGWQRANVKEMRRGYIHATAVPADLVEASSKAAAACETIWREARITSDFKAVEDSMKHVLNLTKEIGAAKADKLKCSLYDALLDQYEPDGKSADIDPIFDDYAAFLPDFLQEVLDHQKSQGLPVQPKGPFPKEVQKKLTRKFAEAVGFDFMSGRMDESAHPFSTGYKGDSRITVRYDEDDFASGIMAVLHECGHAMYEQGLPDQWQHQPVGDARGMAIHESQSLIVEMQACRSPEFVSWVGPQLAAAFGDDPAYKADNLYKIYTTVKPDFIRVDADEVTYPAHVILRYRLEKAMLEGDMNIGDLPSAWNEGMQQLLGIVPPDHARGCMQDIHWYDGAWGYFPTYTLGAMTAAQLYEKANFDQADIKPALAKGDFGPLLSWLRQNIHSAGSRYSTAELTTRATGKNLDPNNFKAHLKRRYLLD